MVSFCGIQIGPVLDVYGPTWLTVTSLALYIATFISLGDCQDYWHFVVVMSLVASAATPIVFVVPVAVIGQYFRKRRETATGLAMSGGSLGGILFPLILETLDNEIGFAWTTPVIDLITAVMLLAGCILLCPRKAKKNVFPDFRILLHPAVNPMTLGVFFIEWGFFIGLEYIASYALANGISKRLSYLMVVFLNAGSFPGRWLAGIVADKFGRMKTMIMANLLCVIAMLAIWLPANGNVIAVIVFVVVFGFASVSNISLVPVCVGESCSTQDYGRYYSTGYTVVSLGALTGVTIAGEILLQSSGAYLGLIIFAGVSYVAGFICFLSLVLLKNQLV
ncbi:mfs monocarboxylate transporter [Colletotrichum incanum]|uniref:Mfs monocarboxylate transporter n=1 Tax=Colletotrichum incanum TaxID=1573173 RepID=A0A162NDV2_COLIC|nr:mfs monocarboxylate transporter [Colletotrichum incanum]